jgi:hypothetical protein
MSENKRIPQVGEKGWTYYEHPVDIIAVHGKLAWTAQDGVGNSLRNVANLTPPEPVPVGYTNHYFDDDHHRDRATADSFAMDGRTHVIVEWSDGTITVEPVTP